MASDYEELLSPYQRVLERNQLGQRILEADVASNAARAAAQANPLTRERELAPQAGAVPVEESAVTAAPAPRPNPFIRPPVPLAAMPLAQQLAWQDREDAMRRAQIAENAQLLATDMNRRKMDQDNEQLVQGRKIINELPKLQDVFNSGKHQDYLAARAELLRRNPAGAVSPEVKEMLAPLDARYEALTKVEDDLRKTGATRAALFDQRRLESGLKEADKYGPEVARQYAAMMTADPEAADLYLAGKQRENLAAVLNQAGIPPEEVTRAYGDPASDKFKVAAAQQALKTRASLATEKSKAATAYAYLDKKRIESKFDPADAKAGKDPYANSIGWTPEDETMWQETRDYYKSLQPALDNRAGVTGVEGALGGQSLYRDYVRPEPGAGAQGTPQRVPVSQQALTTDPVGTQKTINGVEMVKRADGWHKIIRRTQ
jgi:hypothetical protein